MPYKSEPMAAVLKNLNSRYFLPAIQREFVWDQDQVIELFDSIMRGYPISSFLLWELEDQNRDKWEIYKFIEHFDQRRHNERATTHGVHQLTLILDGQQRFTSLLIGLKGSYTTKLKYKRWNDPGAFVKQSLYLDLLKDPKRDVDPDKVEVLYGFTFSSTKPVNRPGEYHYKVGTILDFDSEDAFLDHLESLVEALPDSVTRGQQRVFRSNLQRLYRAVWKDDVVAYYTEHDQSYDRVLDIFVRANEGGTKLSKSDLLLSMVTSQWSGVNARDEIYGFVDRLNYELTRSNDFDKDFVMKTCLVVSDLPVQYKVDNFSDKNLSIIQKRWPLIKSATEATVELVNGFGIDRDTLTSRNALIPIVYYLAKIPGVTLGSNSSFDVTNADSVRRWILMVLLNNVFGGSSDTLLTETRQVITDAFDEGHKDFPVEAIGKQLRSHGRSAGFDEAAINNFLEIGYGRRESFLALSMLYDDRNWGTVTYHRDHIFPKSQFSAAALKRACIPESDWAKYTGCRDMIGNLQLLTAAENQEKSGKDFAQWLAGRDSGYRKRHLIPGDKDLYDFSRFLDFLDSRETLIRERLVKLFP